MAEADDIKNHGKQLRILGWGLAATLAGAAALWFFGTAIPEFIEDAHADEHQMSQQTLQRVEVIAKSNAEYINSQILAQLYLRAGRLREDVQEDPGDSGVRDALARAEVEIRRREAQLAQPGTP